MREGERETEGHNHMLLSYVLLSVVVWPDRAIETINELIDGRGSVRSSAGAGYRQHDGLGTGVAPRLSLEGYVLGGKQGKTVFRVFKYFPFLRTLDGGVYCCFTLYCPYSIQSS